MNDNIKSEVFKKKGYDIIRTVTLEETWTPKRQIEIRDGINQEKTQLRQQINEGELGLVKLKEKEEKLREEKKKIFKKINVEVSEAHLIAKLKILLNNKKKELLNLSFDKTLKCQDYVEDKELWKRVLYTGFLKEISVDQSIIAEIPASILNEYALGRSDKTIIKKADLEKELNELVK